MSRRKRKDNPYGIVKDSNTTKERWAVRTYIDPDKDYRPQIPTEKIIGLAIQGIFDPDSVDLDRRQIRLMEMLLDRVVPRVKVQAVGEGGQSASMKDLTMDELKAVAALGEKAAQIKEDEERVVNE